MQIYEGRITTMKVGSHACRSLATALVNILISLSLLSAVHPELLAQVAERSCSYEELPDVLGFKIAFQDGPKAFLLSDASLGWASSGGKPWAIGEPGKQQSQTKSLLSLTYFRENDPGRFDRGRKLMAFLN